MPWTTASPAERAEKCDEARIRGLAWKHGYALRKARGSLTMNNRGGYMLVDADRNWVVAGERFDLDLDDVEAFLRS